MAGKKSRKKPVHVKTPFSAHKLSPPPPPSACNLELISGSPPAGEATNDASATHPIINSSVKMCRHLEKGVNIEKLSSKLSKAKFSIPHCQDCAKDSKSGGGKKAKGRSNRKKAGVVVEQSAPHLQKKWVCLACGHIGCGSLLTHTNKKSEQQESAVDNEKYNDKKEAPMGHASKHSLCANHPLALRVADNLTCWCFTCNMAIDCIIDASPQLASSSSPFQAAVKMVQDKLLKEKGLLKDPGKRDIAEELVRCSVDDASQSNSTLVLPPSPPISMHRIGTRRKRTVKGLMNLGNTCFFNSVMQNLLALDILRDYFSQEHLDGEGPLTSSLRKLYLETNLDGGGQLSTSSDASGYESGLKKGGKGRAVWELNGGACNPRSLFGAICAKAPRFRGFQQQDSHELLRCLLDGLTSEERSARAKSTCNEHFTQSTIAAVPNRLLTPNGDSSNPEPLEGEREHKHSRNTGLPLVPTTNTVVESFFGGQLCSTVRCCECGHSSVVYETMLDLSLQIPTQLTSKKGQKSANQWKPSSFGGGSQQREVSQTKVPQKESLGKVPNATAVVETNKSSLKAVLSSQGSQTYPLAAAGASSPKLALMESSPLDDVWMDFIDGGIQCAESSIQGSADVPNSIETSENLVVDTENCRAESTVETASHSSTVAVISCQDEHKTEFAVPKDATDDAMPSTGVQNGQLRTEGSDADTPKISVKKEVLKPLAHSEGEDGPLPLASGVLLLSYEPLEVSSNSRGEESSASFDLAGQCSLMDVSSLPFESDGDLDGFAQLFEEEESSSAVTQDVKPSGGNLEGDQVVEESSWDDGVWEADSAAYDRNDVAPGSQRVANYEDAILPMSLESCLADFTKAELLCGENAWECESCTRRLKEQGKNRENTINSATNEAICGSEDLAELQAGREVACFTLSTPGNCPQDSSGKLHLVSCAQNGHTGEGCESLSGEFNESVTCRSSMCAVLDHKADNNQNGSTHLTNLNGGQLYESQSPPCQADIKSISIVNNEHSNNRASDMPKSQKNNETGTPEHADNANMHLFDAEPHVEKKAQEDCSSLEHTHFVALPNSSKEKLISPVSKSITEAKRKTKSKLHAEKLVKKDATKKLSISKAPTILTVHLKRFAQDMRGRLSKLSGHVSFPEFLDLRPFLDTRCLNSDSCYYQLVGVVEHGGTMRGGHYIAYVRSSGVEETSDSTGHGIQDSWYYVSDSSIRKASLQAVLNSEAYLLFYEKCEAKKAE